MAAYLDLKAYPDVRPALESLNQAGIRLAFLSTMTLTMFDTATQRSCLEDMFEFTLSKAHTYKPDPRLQAKRPLSRRMRGILGVCGLRNLVRQPLLQHRVTVTARVDEAEHTHFLIRHDIVAAMVPIQKTANVLGRFL